MIPAVTQYQYNTTAVFKWSLFNVNRETSNVAEGILMVESLVELHDIMWCYATAKHFGMGESVKYRHGKLHKVETCLEQNSLERPPILHTVVFPSTIKTASNFQIVEECLVLSSASWRKPHQFNAIYRIILAYFSHHWKKSQFLIIHFAIHRYC